MNQTNDSFKVGGDADKLKARAERANQKRRARQAEREAEARREAQAREAEYRRQAEEAKKQAAEKTKQEAEEARVRAEEAKMWAEANKKQTRSTTGSPNLGRKIRVRMDGKEFDTLNDALRAAEPKLWAHETPTRRSSWTRINKQLKAHGYTIERGHRFEAI